LVQSSVLATEGRVIQTAGPWLTTLPTREGTAPIQIGGSTAFDLLRFGLVTGGFQGLQGRLIGSDARTIGPTDAGAVAGMAFDLTSVKAFLSSQRLNPATVRASLRVTPLRTLTAELFATDLSPAPPARSSTTIALLDTPSAPTQIIAFADFPGFSGLDSPARSNLGDLEQAIAAAPMARKATLPIGSTGSLSPLTFDVSATVQRELQGQSREASVGFILASELNATGIAFADSSWAVPGAQEILAPHLVLELPGFRAPRDPTFVVSTTKIPFNWLRQESRDLLLVTVSNLGSREGRVRVDLPRGSSFALLPAPGATLNLDNTNSATIPAGGHLTFGVTFQPRLGVNDPDSQTLPILDTTTSRRREVSRIQLDGLGVPDNTEGQVPAIVAPIIPQFTLMTFMSQVNPLNKLAALPWLFGSLLLVGLLGFTRLRSRRRVRSKLNHG
jgi:hypothetical protein